VLTTAPFTDGSTRGYEHRYGRRALASTNVNGAGGNPGPRIALCHLFEI